MMTCIMLVNAERQQMATVAETLASLAQVTEVYSVSGQYDLVAVIQVTGPEALSALVTHQLAAISGIVRTETMLSLRSYRKQDLDAMFDIGSS
ncbi:Lrp/AsnC ligand binding domain-containing protein [Methylophilus sp. DW102]|uniref:Lrp/AsnC family transcriptional regulator n=1 Tax=Methylophilus sp. DW102 TaxID=3095607 RepID=UPI00308B57DE|nr:Lrp/AsnC ligand binding domain-containing protein [Methylophilus sp. DW102]